MVTGQCLQIPFRIEGWCPTIIMERHCFFGCLFRFGSNRRTEVAPILIDVAPLNGFFIIVVAGVDCTNSIWDSSCSEDQGGKLHGDDTFYVRLLEVAFYEVKSSCVRTLLWAATEKISISSCL